jgi:hypothetical protein
LKESPSITLFVEAHFILRRPEPIAKTAHSLASRAGGQHNSPTRALFMRAWAEVAMQIAKWGNSLAVQLPKAVVDALRLTRMVPRAAPTVLS